MQNRSGRLLATRDTYIKALLNDPLYQVLPEGKVLTRVAPTGKIYVDPTKWRDLGYLNDDGYVEVSYARVKLPLHRVVYMKFKSGIDGNPVLEEDLIVNHKDGVRSNCHPDNLEAITQGKNVEHRFRDLKRGAVIGNAVLNWEKVRAIRADRALGLTYRQLVEKYDISKGHVSEIVNHRIWVEGYEYSPISQQKFGA